MESKLTLDWSREIGEISTFFERRTCNFYAHRNAHVAIRIMAVAA